MKVLFCANDREGTNVGGPDIWISKITYYLKEKGLDSAKIKLNSLANN
jgi:hypothetical protein